MIWLNWLVLTFSLLLSGCAATQLSEVQEKQIRNVAVVVLVPERANVQRIGLTAFNNEKMELDVGDAIVETIESSAAKRLSAGRPGWSLKRIKYDRETLLRRLRGPGMVIASEEERIEKELAELASSNGLDAMLVITPQRYDTLQGDGVGLWLRTLSISSIQRAAIHSNIAVNVVGANGKVMAKGVGLPQDPKSINPGEYGIAYDLKANVRPDLVKRLSADIAQHVAASVNKRFDQLGI
jgi:hypothetical protein